MTVAAISNAFNLEIKREQVSGGSRRLKRVAQMFYPRLHLDIINFRHIASECEVL
jgi:hypothetical protein